MSRRDCPVPFQPTKRINTDSQRRLQRKLSGSDDVIPRSPRSSSATSSGIVETNNVEGWDFVSQDAYQRDIVQLLKAVNAERTKHQRSFLRKGGEVLDHRGLAGPRRKRSQSRTVDTSCNCTVQ